MYKKYLFSITILFFFQTCSQKKAQVATSKISDLKSKIEQFITCHNTRDQACLYDLYHPDRDRDRRNASLRIYGLAIENQRCSERG